MIRPVLVAILATLALSLPTGDAAAQGGQTRQVCVKNMGGFVASATIRVTSFGQHKATGDSPLLALGNEFCMTVPADVNNVSVAWSVMALPENRRCHSGASVSQSSRQVHASVHGTVFNPHCYVSER